MNLTVPQTQLVAGKSQEADTVLLVNQLRATANQRGAYAATATTAGSTPKSVWQMAMQASAAWHVTATFLALLDSGAGASYKRSGTFKADAQGAVTQMGSIDTIGSDHADVPTWGVSMAAYNGGYGKSGVQLNVIGDPVEKLSWSVYIDVLWGAA